MTIQPQYVRKAIYDAVNSTYPCYDMQVTGKSTPTSYVIISTQNDEEDKVSKCGSRWVSYTLLDIVNIYNIGGNVGSRLANDIMRTNIKTMIENITIDGYTVINRRYEYPPTINTTTPTQSVFRNFIRVILTLEEII